MEIESTTLSTQKSVPQKRTPTRKRKRIAKRKIRRVQSWNAELGSFSQLSQHDQSDGKKSQDNKAYLLVGTEARFEPTRGSDSYVLSAAMRGWYENEKNQDVSIRQLTFSSVQKRYRWDLGFQEIGWGETFGTYILDLVNPRDYRDPLLDDLSWLRVPVFALNAKYFANNTTLQLIATPYPKNNQLPKAGTYFDPFDRQQTDAQVDEFKEFKLDRYGADGEYGARVSHLFDNGLEAALTYFNYWNRNLLFILDEAGRIIPVQNRMQTLGLSFSLAFESVVLRSDTAFHIAQPVQYQLFGSVQDENVTQSVFGMDINTEDRWIFGTQIHVDAYEKETLEWASVQIQKEWLQGDMRSELFVFHGLDNADVWIQPRQTWNATESLTLSLTADFISADQKTPHTYLNALANKDRYMARLVYLF